MLDSTCLPIKGSAIAIVVFKSNCSMRMCPNIPEKTNLRSGISIMWKCALQSDTSRLLNISDVKKKDDNM